MQTQFLSTNVISKYLEGNREDFSNRSQTESKCLFHVVKLRRDKRLSTRTTRRRLLDALMALTGLGTIVRPCLINADTPFTLLHIDKVLAIHYMETRPSKVL